jgi:hypothetical protein
MKNLRKIMGIKDYRERNLTLRRYVYKYGKFKKHITTEGYEIFRIKDINARFILRDKPPAFFIGGNV